MDSVINKSGLKKAICIHNRQQYQCKDCKGTGFCIHNKRKIICRDCGGKGICIHNKIKYSCKECKGKEICIHNKQKYTCKECKKSRLYDTKYNVLKTERLIAYVIEELGKYQENSLYKMDISFINN